MIQLIKQYAENRLELLKLEASEKSSQLIGGIIVYSLVIFFAFFFFILLNIGIGLLIGHYLDNYAYGVLIVSGFYLLVIVLVLALKKAIKLRIINKFLKTLYK